MPILKIAATVAAVVIVFGAIAVVFHANTVAGLEEGEHWTARSYLRTAGILLAVMVLTLVLLYACYAP